MTHQQLTKQWKRKKIAEFNNDFVKQVADGRAIYRDWKGTPDGVLTWVLMALDEAIERGYAEAESDIARWSDTE